MDYDETEIFDSLSEIIQMHLDNTIATAATIVEIEDGENGLDALFEQSKGKFIMVAHYMERCAASNMLLAILPAVAREFSDNVVFAKLDIEEPGNLDYVEEANDIDAASFFLYDRSGYQVDYENDMYLDEIEPYNSICQALRELIDPSGDEEPEEEVAEEEDARDIPQNLLNPEEIIPLQELRDRLRKKDLIDVLRHLQQANEIPVDTSAQSRKKLAEQCYDLELTYLKLAEIDKEMYTQVSN